ncbi:transcription initiation factor TFIID subunit 8 [Sesamum indicum]|uniref:Transcription initiation factor TFIID subunit 8 n=1 Tax=Sesamum indicum TaxID=4182 RepID=A0A8M8V5X4_SESIN|nr:transcription initiation factor TFIID subunit 8 [Sesamum indicum]
MRGTSLRQKQLPPRLDGVGPISESEFSFTITRVAVAQICHSVGFYGAQNSALEALTDITTRYLEAIGKLGAASSNSDRRTQSNLPDFIVALEDLASIQGFPGLSDIRSHSLWTSAVINDLMKLVKYRDEIPFAQPLPPKRSFVQGAKRKLLKHTGDNKRLYCNGGSWRHVPSWLPPVPVVEEKDKEQKGEVKWECWEEREEEKWDCRRETVERECNNENFQVSGKRGKVRFRMGVGLDNKVVRVRNLRVKGVTAGIGKRVNN